MTASSREGSLRRIGDRCSNWDILGAFSGLRVLGFRVILLGGLGSSRRFHEQMHDLLV